MSRCYGITALPESFGKLALLNNLDMRWCASVTALPDSFGDLTALIQLDLTWCTALRHVPSLTRLSALAWLDLSGCPLLSPQPELPDGLTRADADTYEWWAGCDACRVSHEPVLTLSFPVP
jgi:hypothetical protein